ncbi:MAG TPA: phosphatidylserine decarboxylase [Elusimicrobiota bacterium]|jgi:phosphatidylserine decarboxylase|nr:phosphatidylserine decarboxylase [Elusimicrobiota bacterium]
MKIAEEGRAYIGLGVGALVGGWLLGHILPWLGHQLIVLGAVFAAFCAYFFRDPDRPPPPDADKIYAPGDGRVLSVAREGPGDVTTVRIFLSIFDVHVQRLPCSGVVDMVRYQPGSFKMAMEEEARLNERSIVRVKPDGRADSVTFEQIAGYVARRIVCKVKEGDRAVAGERYGVIHFGSQAAVHLPASAKPLVVPGARVVAGVTPIAQWNPAP